MSFDKLIKDAADKDVFLWMAYHYYESFKAIKENMNQNEMDFVIWLDKYMDVRASEVVSKLMEINNEKETSH